MAWEELVEKALEARKRAYAPYSGFAVGAALLTGSGRIFSGCNIENASYPLTTCAERTAVVKAVDAGEREFQAIAVAADCDDVCTPCGACRQILQEFAPEITVVMANARGNVTAVSLSELLPHSFHLNKR